MKRTLWAAFFAALLLASAFLAACGQKQGTLGSFEWAIEPQYEFEKVEPVLDSAPMQEGVPCTRPGEAGYYLAQTQRGWGVLDTATGRLAAEGAFPRQPFRCGMGHLYSPDAQYTYEQGAEYNAQLAALGSTFEMEVGHGGGSQGYFWSPQENAVYRAQFVETNFDWTPLNEAEPRFEGLLPVRKGALRADFPWRDPPTWEDMALEENGLYAIASPQGELLTGFIYDAACMAGPELIAVQKGGRWGYVNGEGDEVIPCGYEGFWGAAAAWDSAAQTYVYSPANYPAPCTEGCVVVKKDGETGVLRADGSVLLAFGEVEDAVPAHGGLLWVKTGGKWGALRLPAAPAA